VARCEFDAIVADTPPLQTSTSIIPVLMPKRS